MMQLATQELALCMENKTLISQLTIEFKPGEIWGILGQNGSGKSTLLKALAGLITPCAGRIILNQTPLPLLSRSDIAKHIGILFQENPFTFPQTCWEYCLSARYPHTSYRPTNHLQEKRMILQALKRMALLPYKHRRIDRLSGGEKKRLALASLLTQSPAIYLLDEPTNHLDLKHQIDCLMLLRDLAKTQNACIIMALHDINLAQQFCERLLLLLPDGSTKHGTTPDMLTKAHLSDVYQCDIITASPQTPFWQAVLS